ncbi:MAG TPA: CpaF family protein [Thermoflexus sp.]|nr:CpaF family protein [Thermoflexus sp.]
MSRQDAPLSPEHYTRLRAWLIQQLQKGSEPPPVGMTPENWAWVRDRVTQLLASARISLPPEILDRLLEEVGDEVVGYGPIGPLVRDPSITEIMVNGPSQIYVERNGKIVEVDVRFRDDQHVMEVIERILKPLGRKVDRTWPMADARLPDGSRVNVIIPPCALNGPTITIRKFPARRLTVEDLIRFGTMTPEMAEFLRACVIARLNIVVSGGTGSGKTTLLNVLSAFIPEDERIVTIEDAAELQLQQRHVVRLEAAPALPDGTGRVTIRDLVINALRMRPDRIIVGECRGPEALDMLQAMNTGHEGSMTTIHANSPRDALSRLETMVLMAGMDLPLRVVRTQIASAIDLIVQQERLRDGSRKITRITEIQGMEGDTVVLQDLFIFQAKAIGEEQGKVEGVHRPTGIRPHFMSRLEAAGIRLSPQIFGVGTLPAGRMR